LLEKLEFQEERIKETNARSEIAELRIREVEIKEKE